MEQITIYCSIVQSSLIYGSDRREMTKRDGQQINVVEMDLLRMCNVPKLERKKNLQNEK